MKNTLKVLGITLVIWLVLVFLFGCKKVQFDEQMRPWKTITIKKGKQRTGIKLRLSTNKNGLTEVVKFNETAKYYLGNENQNDVNKVSGYVEKEFSKPDSYSAMIGWRWFDNWTTDKSDDRLQLLAFVNYEQGNFDFEVMVDFAEIGEPYYTSIYTQSNWNNGNVINNYSFHIHDTKFKEWNVKIKREVSGIWKDYPELGTKIEVPTTKAELKFSFGGQSVAPHDIELLYYYIR